MWLKIEPSEKHHFSTAIFFHFGGKFPVFRPPYALGIGKYDTSCSIRQNPICSCRQGQTIINHTSTFCDYGNPSTLISYCISHRRHLVAIKIIKKKLAKGVRGYNYPHAKIYSHLRFINQHYLKGFWTICITATNLWPLKEICARCARGVWGMWGMWPKVKIVVLLNNGETWLLHANVSF